MGFCEQCLFFQESSALIFGFGYVSYWHLFPRGKVPSMIDVMLQINEITEGPIKDLTLHVTQSLFPSLPDVEVKLPETVGDFAPNFSHGDFAPHLEGSLLPQGQDN